ncbi:Transcription factor mbp1 [Tilletia horrida]|uniref:Transcription factor mbp1 n=1 Tax=Tilletia horrida TaxID=155126 RepID=A0AAN6GAH5_9BASI|nr:Transcription factor mbp1 [Tilletia horrida]KAK0533517.1 Transcription factor mbp1 [Tilletia horrida]KAK0533774.1 Transcription factor mbp1 [Tilletia horrida]KAK0567062.1 Transcription factor mbp1 [Tilletia horrida]
MPPKTDTTIYKAVYSGVPVYECIINDVAVMRRRADSWLNATQILKVVGLDKPQRTRILEREVQKGTHEKIQGGYGKYQGTWIPLDSAVKLAAQYNVSNLFEPITSYVPSAQSPPPAPKHNVSAGRSSVSKKATPSSSSAAANAAKRAQSAAAESSRMERDEGSISPPPSQASSASKTPSPVPALEGLQETLSAHSDSAGRMLPPSQPPLINTGPNVDNAAKYAEMILDYFISESTTIPAILTNPPADFDANMSIDDDEHTALHWACAMGRVRVVKLLLSAGSDIFRVNLSGQTALMRAAMFSNNYDLRKFPELFELLHRSVLNIDRQDRTVFHHIIDLALSRGKPHASRYYLETMCNRLAEYPSQLADILNFQDEEGETALTMAARARSKRLVRILLEHGADPKLRNKEGKSAEDYIIEDERFRASPALVTPSVGLVGPGGVGASGAAGAAYLSGPDGLPIGIGGLHNSEAGQRAATRAVSLLTTLLGQLAQNYDDEIGTVDKKLSQAHALLSQIQSEIAECTRVKDDLDSGSGGANGAVAADGGANHAESDAGKLAEAEEKIQGVLEKRSRDQVEAEWKVENGDGRPLSEVKKARLQLQADSSKSNLDLDGQIAALRTQLNQVRERRSKLITDFIARAREQGTGKVMASYRRLIAAGCGGLAKDEVDAVVGVLCELLEEGGDKAKPTGS